jgi:hypothetical protein
MTMTPPTAFARTLSRRLVPVLGALLLLLLTVGSAHHHADGDHHACVICTVGHSPAITAGLTAPVAAPAGPAQALQAAPRRTPRSLRIEAAPSRAPPLA